MSSVGRDKHVARSNFAHEKSAPVKKRPASRKIATKIVKLELLHTAEKMRKLIQPLLPIEGRDVYFVNQTNPHAVFKPGKTNTVKAILCAKVAKIVGLDASVPKAIEARVPQLVSSDDLDTFGNPIEYEEVLVNGQKWLINPDDALGIRYERIDSEGHFIKLEDGSSYILEQVGDAYYAKVTSDDEETDTEDSFDDELVVIASIDDEPLLVRKSGAHLVSENEDSPHVMRRGVRYDFEESKLVAKDVEGFLQPFVKDVVTEIGGNKVDVTRSSTVRNTFYAMINMNSFIDSMVLATLFRTQDGKATSLEETNFLFTQEKDHLNLVLIDLDETFPIDNGITKDPELAKHGDVAALRLGLMGYPQAHQNLEGEAKEHLEALLTTIEANKARLVRACSKYQDKEVQAAFTQVLDRLQVFHETKTHEPYTLADLVFFVFPEYEKQWQQLAKTNLSKEEIAAYIGYGSIAELQAHKPKLFA